MRIGLTVDALSPRLTGIGRYTWELCQGLHDADEITDLAFFRFNEWVRNPDEFLSPQIKQYRGPKAYRRWMARRGFKRRLVHGTNYFLPSPAESGIVTVHDLSVFSHPDAHPAERIRSFEKEFLSSLNRASHVITDSNTIRQELIEQFSLAPDRVRAVYLGVSEAFKPQPHSLIAPDIRRLVGSDVKDYILCVATFEPRKRIEAAISAHALMCDRAGLDIPLVLVGAVGWKNERLHDLIHAEQAKNRLIVLGYVPEENLPTLYAGAKLFLYPSIYEGFGLPPIEAMRSGVPVIVANRSCLPEVTRGGALLVDPDDLDSFAEAIENALVDKELRQRLIATGLTVASSYTWRRCVEDTLDVYRIAAP